MELEVTTERLAPASSVTPTRRGLFYGGAWHDAASGRRFPVTSPGSGASLGEAADADATDVEEARQELSRQGGTLPQSLVLGLTPGLVRLVGGDIVTEAQAELPGISLSVIEELSFLLVEVLERDELDVALAYEVGDRPGLVRVPLLEEEPVLVTAADGEPAPPGDDPIDLAEALRNPLVLARDRDPLRHLIKSAADRLSVPLDLAFEASSIALMKRVILSGTAAGIMPPGTVADEVQRGLLHTRRLRNPRIARTLYLVRSSRGARLRREKEVNAFLHRLADRVATSLGPLARRLPQPG